MSDVINPVPCNGCRRCCINDAVRLLPNDSPERYKTERHPNGKDLMLAHKRNRECFYLDKNGCTIQDSKPQMCGEMDCRLVYKNVTYTKARKMRVLGVWNKGKELAA